MLPLVLATGLIHTILILALAGFLVWVITTYIPMPDIIRKLIYVVVTVVLVLWLLQVFGDVNI